MDDRLAAALEEHAAVVDTYRAELGRYIVVGNAADGLRAPELVLDEAGLAHLRELSDRVDETERAYERIARGD